MEQKVIQIGNSTGVIIPKILLEKVGLQAGSQVVLEQDSTGSCIVMAKIGTKLNSSFQASNFMEILERVNKQYGSALEELAQK